MIKQLKVAYSPTTEVTLFVQKERPYSYLHAHLVETSSTVAGGSEYDWIGRQATPTAQPHSKQVNYQSSVSSIVASTQSLPGVLPIPMALQTELAQAAKQIQFVNWFKGSDEAGEDIICLEAVHPSHKVSSARSLKKLEKRALSFVERYYPNVVENTKRLLVEVYVGAWKDCLKKSAKD
jgi:hypothetical protein